jgi:DNA polymerase III delta prime subunit
MIEKYKPTKFSEIVGNKTAVQTLGKWMLTWPAVSTCALVSGPCGVGKTLTIDLLIKQPEYNVMEVNPDDERNEGYLKQHVAPFVKTKKNIWGKSNVLVVNDVDVSNDHGFLGALCACIKETKIPIILTCNERYDPKIKTLAALCTDIKFFKPSTQEICRYITDLVKKELNTNRLTPKQIQLIQTATETAEGDVRNAILSTEFNLICVNIDKTDPITHKKTKDKMKPNLFELTTDFMSQLTEYVDKAELFNMEKDLLPLMVHENYPSTVMKTKVLSDKQYASFASSKLTDYKPFHLSVASSQLSDYDMFPYEYGSSSVIQATAVCHSSSKINFTGYLGKMSTKTKKTNTIVDIESRLLLRLPVGHFRLDYMSYMLKILYNCLGENNNNNITGFVDKCISYGFTKEDIQDNLPSLLITDGFYTSCDYSNIDKKVKASITKTFTKQEQIQTQLPKPVAKTKAKATNATIKAISTEPSAEKKTPVPRKTAAKKGSSLPSVVPATSEPKVAENITFTVTELEQTPVAIPDSVPPKARTTRKKSTKTSTEVNEIIPIPDQIPVTRTRVIRKNAKKTE